jgi:hypothetical protein
LGGLGNADPHRVQPQAPENLTGMGRIMHLHESLSMIVLIVNNPGVTVH